MATALVSTEFSQEAFDEFLASRTEPTWVNELRQVAWQRFCELDMPTLKDEQWTRTDIRLFKINRFGFPETSESVASETALVNATLLKGVEAGGTLCSSSGVTQSKLDPHWASQGVLFGSLEELLNSHGDVLKPYLMRQLVDPMEDKFSALNAACWNGGMGLFVPKNVTVDQPLYSLSAMPDGGVDLGKTLVILEEGAEATVLTESISASTNADEDCSKFGGLHCGSIELIVEARAKLRYVNLQNWGSQAWHFAHQMAHVGEAATLQWTIGALGSRLAKVNQQVALTGSDAEVQVNGVMFTEGKQHLSYNTHQHHKAPHCRSDLLYKNALQDTSRTVWRGMIKVDKEAQRTDAYQRNDNLMLVPTARADSIPGLEIEADDVRCTHGSTSGNVDAQQVFYAMNRGYTHREAVRMIVTGFFQQVFDRITIESVRDALSEAIGDRVRDIDE